MAWRKTAAVSRVYKDKNGFFLNSHTLFAKRSMKFNFINTNLTFCCFDEYWNGLTLKQYMQTVWHRFPLVSIREITSRGLKLTNKSNTWILFNVAQHTQCHPCYLVILHCIFLKKNIYVIQFVNKQQHNLFLSVSGPTF